MRNDADGRSEKVWRSECAQAMTEYILVASLLMIGASYSFNLFGRILISYYDLVSIIVALPIP